MLLAHIGENTGFTGKTGSSFSGLPYTFDSGGCDGVTVDTKGNLHLTTDSGIQVVTPEGKLLGTIKLPKSPANLTFGGPNRRTLYATARGLLYAMPMQSEGLDRSK